MVRLLVDRGAGLMLAAEPIPTELGTGQNSPDSRPRLAAKAFLMGLIHDLSLSF